jgi:hypothetical protein
MMKKLKFLTLIICSFSLLGTSSFAAILDGSEPFLCSIIDVVECSPERECINGEASSVNLPYFVKVDVEDKTIRVPQAEDDSRVTKIQTATHLDGKLLLQGAEHGFEGEDDAVGWTMSIDEDDGRMIFSASREKAGFLIFGACTQP